MKKGRTLASAIALASAYVVGAPQAEARDYIHIVGSSTVYPFSKAVSDQLEKSSGKKGPKFKAPWLESTGTKGGIQLFCEGDGEAYADIVNTARRMTRKEFDQCQANGVRDIVEVAVGHDAIVFAQSKKSPAMRLTRRDVYLAVSRMIPDSATKTVAPNRNKTWKQVNGALPDRKIAVIGPPGNAGFSEIFREAVLEPGCDAFPWLAAKRNTNSTDYKRACQDVRSDEGYDEAAINDERIVRELTVNEPAIALMPFSLFAQHQDKLDALEVDGVVPSSTNVASEQYPLSGTLYFYIKKSHVDYIPSLGKFVQEFTNEKAFGEKGYLVQKGLIPLTKEDRKVATDIVKLMAPMSAP
ncbi:MAG: substrate-binding domain-containing protein [Methylotetracoccus sp.]